LPGDHQDLLSGSLQQSPSRISLVPYRGLFGAMITDGPKIQILEVCRYGLRILTLPEGSAFVSGARSGRRCGPSGP
jgi:hypothetical protein